MTENVVTS